jgi:hypothetical protein
MDDFIGSWDIETWDEESRALALRFEEVGSGRCWIYGKIGIGQNIDELANTIDEIGEDVLDVHESPVSGRIGDRSLNGFWIEWVDEVPSFPKHSYTTLWHVHPDGVFVSTFYDPDGEVEEVIDYTMTLDQLEEYMNQLPRRFTYFAEKHPYNPLGLSDEERAENAVIGKAMEAADPEGVERYGEICNIFTGALIADDATALEDYLESGVWGTGDDQRELASQVTNLYQKYSPQEVADYIPMMIAELVPDMPEYVVELASSEILRVLYRESEED